MTICEVGKQIGLVDEGSDPRLGWRPLSVDSVLYIGATHWCTRNHATERVRGLRCGRSVTWSRCACFGGDGVATGRPSATASSYASRLLIVVVLVLLGGWHVTHGAVFTAHLCPIDLNG